MMSMCIECASVCLHSFNANNSYLVYMYTSACAHIPSVCTVHVAGTSSYWIVGLVYRCYIYNNIQNDNATLVRLKRGCCAMLRHTHTHRTHTGHRPTRHTKPHNMLECSSIALIWMFHVFCFHRWLLYLLTRAHTLKRARDSPIPISTLSIVKI